MASARPEDAAPLAAIRGLGVRFGGVVLEGFGVRAVRRRAGHALPDSGPEGDACTRC